MPQGHTDTKFNIFLTKSNKIMLLSFSPAWIFNRRAFFLATHQQDFLK